MARADGLVAIVADPVYSADDRRVSGRPEGEQSTEERLRSFAIPSLRRLEHSGQEAQTIASLVPGDRTLVLAGFDANRSRVLESDLGSYLYVHFAAHGMIDTEYPKVSSLVLSQVDESGRAEEDGYLRLHDIYGMELDNVDMVVLSACETALGKEVRGEGLMGLTRGFLYAGSRRVAASLWQVQDDKTEELMEHFYRGLFEEDRAPADALRHAQIAVRDSEEGDYSFPYYWAGFVLQGEWR
jgi:CHAT domain-containing protein